jgi:hypothetical protein
MRTGAYLEKAYPPDGDGKNWWQRLNKALGTVSSDFVNASLLQIQAAARSPLGIISETVDAAFGTERRIAALASAAARLLKAYAMQVQVLRRLRNGGQQFMRIEHVHINEGGQAIIANVKRRIGE